MWRRFVNPFTNVYILFNDAEMTIQAFNTYQMVLHDKFATEHE